MAASKSSPKQAGRDARGRFQRGASGNPAGRPAGASCRAIVMARSWAEEKGLPLLMAAAEAGDMDAARILIQVGLPRQKPVTLPTELPSLPAGEKLAEQGRAVLEAAARGEISPDAAAAHMGLLRSLAELRQAEDLEARIAALEAVLKQSKEDQ